MPESFFRENGKELFGRLVCERVAEKRAGRGSIYRPDDALCGTKRFWRENSKEVFGRLVRETVVEKRVGRGSI